MSGKGTRRSSLIKKRSRKGERLIEFARKFGIKLGIAVFVLWIGAWIAIAGGFEKLEDWASRKTVLAAADMGFRLDNLMVEGRRYTDADTIKAVINIQKGDPLFSLDPGEAKVMLEKLSWVKEAHVERRLPDTVFIQITERKPLALWQKNKKLSLIDEEGIVITRSNLKRFKDLIIVIGDEAPENMLTLITLLEAEPLIEQKVQAAAFISGRRWNLELNTGAVVKLPENEVGLALRRLAMAAEEGLLSKPLKVIDLRNEDRITVQTVPGAVKHYRAGYDPEDGAI